MAGTPYSTVFDSFMIHIKDWRLIELYQSSVTDFETYLQGFMVQSIQMFKVCRQSLLKDDLTKTFTETLTEENITILAGLMVEKWMEKEVQDVRQMNLKITDRDFKSYAEGQNLKEKSEQWIRVREMNSQALIDYGYDDDTMWTNWINGTFFTPV
jgi:hypothetical protein